MKTQHQIAVRALEMKTAAEADRIINEVECERITSLSRTTRWRLERRGLFPKKFKISPNRAGWRLSEVLAWMRERQAAA